MIQAGPVFDYRGGLRGHALKNASVILLEGTPAGYIMDNIAYENAGRAIGATMGNLLAINTGNQTLGMVGISGMVMDGEERKFMSPFGYLFSADGKTGGRGLALSSIYNLTGAPVAQMTPAGGLINKNAAAIGKLTQSGFNIDERNLVIGKNLEAGYVVGPDGQSLGNLSESNLVLNNNLEPVAKLLPDNTVVSADSNTSVNMMPVVGRGSVNNMVLAFSGSLIGYAGPSGIVRDFNGARLGKVAAEDMVLDNMGSSLGGTVGYAPVIDNKCSLLGVITPRGDIRNYRETVMGRPLLNGQAISENGSYMGYAVKPTAVID